MIRPCCADRIDDRDVQSPYSRLIAFGYYDGATEGFTECRTCRTVYEVKMLAWDSGQDVRGFQLEEKIGASFEDLIGTVSSEKDQPRWPTWVLKSPLPAPAASRISELRAEPVGVRLLVAAEDLTKTILMSKHIGPDAAQSETDDWLKLLRLTRI